MSEDAEAVDQETEADDQGEEPDLDDEDMVDVPEDVAAQVAQETAESGDEDDPADKGGGEEDADESCEEDPENPLTSGTTVGDLYCNALGMAATMAKESRGSGVDDPEDSMEAYAKMARRQMDLDKFVNEWMEAQGGPDELTPGQGIILGTSMFAMGVLMDDPDLAAGVAEEVRDR